MVTDSSLSNNALVYANLCCKHNCLEKLDLLVRDNFGLESYGIRKEEQTIQSLEVRKAFKL